MLGVSALTCVVGVPVLRRVLAGQPTATAALPTTSVPTSTQIVSSTPTSAQVAAAPQPGEPAYEEDFTAPGSEWEISSGDNAEYRVVGGVYSIEVLQESWIAWNNIGLEFADFEIEFEVALVEGDSYNDAGLLFRFVDRDNYYELDINGEGSFSVGKQVDGEWYPILDWTNSPAIQRLGSVNRVRLIAQGSQFEVIVNGQTVGSFGDDTYVSGGIAPVVTAYDTPPARATFDNIRIWELEPR